MTDDWQSYRERALEDEDVRAAYEEARPAYEFAHLVRSLRRELGITQRELARRAGMTQPEIARIERADISPTWATIQRVLAAAGAEMEVSVRNKNGRIRRIALALGVGAGARRRAG